MSDDTIVALATPPGRGGLAVVRLSGPGAVGIAMRLIEGHGTLEPRRATLVRLQLPAGPQPSPQDGGVAGGLPAPGAHFSTSAPGHAAGESAISAISSGKSREVGDSSTLRDEAVVTFFQAPASYTGEDVVEVSLHGSPLLAARLVEAAVGGGARMARAGAFTLRAFLNGKLDLAQAEAVQDLVSATTPVQARMAFDQLQGTLSERIGAIDRRLFELAARLEASVDFPEEGYHFVEPGEVVETLRAIEASIDALLADGHRGRLVRDGATVAIVGRTNVGKSTVFNRLAGSDRAIVTEIPGTTRDLLTETVSIGGVPVTLVDTAGARVTDDPVEFEGVSRARRARDAADLVLLVLDGSMPLADEDKQLLDATATQPRVITLNKADLPARCDLQRNSKAPGAGFCGDSAPTGAGETDRQPLVQISALRGSGIDELIGCIGRALGAAPAAETPSLGNVRHIGLLTRARESLHAAIESLDASGGQMPEEVILSELQATREALEEVTGRRSTEDLLNEIFSRFCVGK